MARRPHRWSIPVRTSPWAGSRTRAEHRRSPGARKTSGRAAVLPTPLPGARGVLFSLCSNVCAQSELWVLDLKSGDARMLVPEAKQGWYLPTGHLAYVRSDGSVLAAPFDLKRLELRGTAVPILDNVATLFGVFPELAFSASGTMAMEVGGGKRGNPAVRDDLDRPDRASDRARFQLDLPAFPLERESRLVALSGRQAARHRAQHRTPATTSGSRNCRPGRCRG